MLVKIEILKSTVIEGKRVVVDDQPVKKSVEERTAQLLIGLGKARAASPRKEKAPPEPKPDSKPELKAKAKEKK